MNEFILREASRFENFLAKFSLVILFSVMITSAKAQSFYAGGGTIYDFKGVFKIDSFPIKVSGLDTKTGPDFGISKICFTIVHPRVSDLKIELLSPDGTSIWLTNRNGKDFGSNYTNTCFRSNGFSGYVHQASAPFTGEYIPDGRLSFLNNGQNPNGTWYLMVQDLRSGERGTINFLTLDFDKNPTPDSDVSPCSMEDGTACKCADGTSDCELLPDLVILQRLTTDQVKEYPWNDPYYPGQLRLAASIANIGDGPMEAFGNNKWYCDTQEVKDSTVICKDKTHPRQQINQRIYKKNGNKLTSSDRIAGTNYYDDKPGHNHYHVDDWVEFRVVKETKNKAGKVVKRQLVSKGSKVSYCLFDSGICNNNDSLCVLNGQTYGNKNLLNYGLGSYVDCKSLKQGISVGGYDTYGMMYEGQFVTLPKGLKSGSYMLEIEVDPTGIYKEKNKSNNTFKMPILISKQE
ncbi:proprotein convertase P-domain-containing protein [Dyadobacter subterraneus]|uniref:proprotein convertase P-domain-containing protein n=1 Tax=Dyadobacter subterraneus TaxID=2773304 RepID=UPI001D16CDAE|nr:proprotein convertase P-domain-containing protein [Dyadobacter subterraneus]